MERESMEVDVVIVGAGPSGLSAAIRLMQLAKEKEQALSVCIVEKGSEVGAHILSGAILETKALDELLPEWLSSEAPINTEVTRDEFYYLLNEEKSIQLPNLCLPKPMHNHGNYIVSMGNVCRWLAEQAEALGVDIFPGFAAQSLIIENNRIAGIVTGDMGLNKSGEQKSSFAPGMELRGKYTLLAEGSRGHLGKEVIRQFHLDKGKSPQHYAIGFKEIWDIPPEQHREGKVVHTAGWPLSSGASGGGYLYHAEKNQVFVGLIIDLNYHNPYLNPFEEFQRMKHHPAIAATLAQGTRVCYGARAITKGGYNSLPKMDFPGGCLIGCDAGTLNFAKIKGNHTAMKSGMLAAESVFQAIQDNWSDAEFEQGLTTKLNESWLYQELHTSRNFGPTLHKFGPLVGGALNSIDQNLFRGNSPFTITDDQSDHLQTKKSDTQTPIQYPKPDGKLSFDRLSSVFLSNTNHEEDQPCHLQLMDVKIPIEVNLPLFDEPAQRYCPAGVYEIIEEGHEPKLQINAQNCIHCKTCDIKDPTQNINWVPPEGTGGPNYPNM
ncbi:electron transfer flavoprotein-ubiquinone oxidoreductase [Algicola sagamiensis]|uniref:electron transfer flavoprotein-ubiquinone oxidoreductase n=1 Tax=Algicola sagamiensis TaxID=163869 RepID=UPI0003A38DF2|nr:electron transfer flavoprotein-ubiquinone oxidoreductase [Algicola sagamiensis]